jgi:hypothetical protein
MGRKGENSKIYEGWGVVKVGRMREEREGV